METQEPPLGVPTSHDRIPPDGSVTEDVMRSGLFIRRAIFADVPSLVKLWDATRNFLREKGIDQWQYSARTGALDSDIMAGNCWVVVMAPSPDTDSSAAGADGILATVTIETHAGHQGPRGPWAPPGAFWSVQDQGLYIRRLLVHPSLRGRGLGVTVLRWAEGRARILGRTALRLAAWTKNDGLRGYYLGQGFQQIDVVEHMMVGAFFERAVPEEGAVNAIGGSDGMVLNELSSSELVEVCSATCLHCAVKRLHEKLAVEEPERC